MTSVFFLGLSTALVERDDFSSGTSSRSTKLIHGGVRYLQKAIMQLDREQVRSFVWTSLKVVNRIIRNEIVQEFVSIILLVVPNYVHFCFCSIAL